MRSEESREVYARVTAFRREKLDAGWTLALIAEALPRQFPEVTSLAAHRLARGLSLAQAIQGIKELYDSDGLTLPPGFTPSRLHEWEHWPKSGRRPGEEARDYLARFYQTRQDKLGFGRDYTKPTPSNPVAEPVEPQLTGIEATRTTSAQPDPEGVQAAELVGLDATTAELSDQGNARELAAPQRAELAAPLPPGLDFDSPGTGVRVVNTSHVLRVELPGTPRLVIEVQEEDEGLRRRVIIRLGGLIATDVLLPRLDLERLAWARANPSRIDVGLLRDLRAITMSYARRLHFSAPSDLLPDARSHLDYLCSLLAGSPPAAVERRLRSITGEAAVLTGWLSFLANDFTDAQRRYAFANKLADEAGDDLLRAQLRIPMSYLHSTRYAGVHGDPTIALRLLTEASHVGARLSAPMRGWAAGCTAAEHACLGHTDAVRRELSKAEDALAEVRPGEELGFLAYWEQTRFDSYSGLCAILLGLGRQAETPLRRALQTADPSLFRHRSGILIDLGVAYVLQHEIEEGCRLLREAYILASQHDLSTVVQRIRSTRAKYLERWTGTPAVQALDELLRMAA
jgi:hypothetical protein